MKKNAKVSTVENFNILFEKLEEAKKEQELVYNLDSKSLENTYSTIELFKEYQESKLESSYTTFTRS